NAEGRQTFIVFARDATCDLQVAGEPVAVDVAGSSAFEQLGANVTEGRNHGFRRGNLAQGVESFGSLAEFGAANGFRVVVGIDALDEVSTADAVHENARDTVDRPAGGEAEGQDAGFLQGRPGGNILIPIGRDGLADLFVGSGGEPQPVPRVDVDRQAVEATFV